jgi:hypothetical protein
MTSHPDSEPASPTPPHEFAEQLIRQVLADLDGILSTAAGAAGDAFALVGNAAAAGAPRGATLYVLVQAALAAHHALLDRFDGGYRVPDEAASSAVVLRLIPAAASGIPQLVRHAHRLTRYFGEAEPAAAALPLALADAIRRLYEGMLRNDATLGGRGLIALRTMVAHVDAVASLLDPADTADRPVRVFPPDRFHDYFLQLTERVQQPQADGGGRPIAALTRDGRLTALITSADHPLQAAAAALRQQIPGSPTTAEHALLRMQGLLYFLDALRQDRSLPFAEALDDQAAYLSLVTAAATTPMRIPGRFETQQLLQIARYNRKLLQPAQPMDGQRH